MRKLCFALAFACSVAYAEEASTVIVVNTSLPDSSRGMLVTEMPLPAEVGASVPPVIGATGAPAASSPPHGLPKIPGGSEPSISGGPALASQPTPSPLPSVGAPVKTYSTLAQAAADGLNPLPDKKAEGAPLPQLAAQGEPPASPMQEKPSAGSRWMLLAFWLVAAAFLWVKYKRRKPSAEAE